MLGVRPGRFPKNGGHPGARRRRPRTASGRTVGTQVLVREAGPRRRHHEHGLHRPDARLHCFVERCAGDRALVFALLNAAASPPITSARWQPRSRGAGLRVVTRGRGLALSARVVLVALVGRAPPSASCSRSSTRTPLLFADEYIYSTLAHELATTGWPTIRGEAAGFPALLQPISTATRSGSSATPGSRCGSTQALNAVAMSPRRGAGFLLGRKLGLAGWVASQPPRWTLLVPDLFYVPFVLGEPIAYPLVLGPCTRVSTRSDGAYAPEPARVRGARRARASFARIQFVVLPLRSSVRHCSCGRACAACA